MNSTVPYADFAGLSVPFLKTCFFCGGLYNRASENAIVSSHNFQDKNTTGMDAFDESYKIWLLIIVTGKADKCFANIDSGCYTFINIFNNCFRKGIGNNV